MLTVAGVQCNTRPSSVFSISTGRMGAFVMQSGKIFHAKMSPFHIDFEASG